MARTRFIKPEFFIDDQIAELSHQARLLLLGLWVLADREGRLKYQPKVIEVQVFPHEDADIEALLEELSRLGFVDRYGSGKDTFLDVPSFREHQRPHFRESESVIPSKAECSGLRHEIKSDPRAARPRPSPERATQALPAQSVDTDADTDSDADTELILESRRANGQTMAEAWLEGSEFDPFELANQWVSENFKLWPWGGNPSQATTELQARIVALKARGEDFDPEAYLEAASRRLPAYRALYQQQQKRRKGDYLPPFHQWLKSNQHETDCAEVSPERSIDTL